MYFSAIVPGFGQIYTGDYKRGLLFLGSIIGAFGAAYASYKLHPNSTLADYDSTALWQKISDGVLNTAETKNWEDRSLKTMPLTASARVAKWGSSPAQPWALVSTSGTSSTREREPTTTTANSRNAESASGYRQAAIALASHSV